MSLFAARNIGMAIENFKSKGYAQLKGSILNSRDVLGECDLVENLAKELNTEIIVKIPRDQVVQECEEKNMCVVEGAPQSQLTGIFDALAITVTANV